MRQQCTAEGYGAKAPARRHSTDGSIVDLQRIAAVVVPCHLSEMIVKSKPCSSVYHLACGNGSQPHGHWIKNYKRLWDREGQTPKGTSVKPWAAHVSVLPIGLHITIQSPPGLSSERQWRLGMSFDRLPHSILHRTNSNVSLLEERTLQVGWS